MAAHESDLTVIKTKLAQVCDRAIHCRMVQVKGFNLIAKHSYIILQKMRQEHQTVRAALFVRVLCVLLLRAVSSVQCVGCNERQGPAASILFAFVSVWSIRPTPQDQGRAAEEPLAQAVSLPRAQSSDMPDAETYSEALRQWFTYVEDFVDDHKEHAFVSAFVAPAKFFWHVPPGHTRRQTNHPTRRSRNHTKPPPHRRLRPPCPLVIQWV